MKIVILAAGKGTRLGHIASPKPLTRLSNGETILGRAVALFRKQFLKSEILIIVGHRKEEIIDAFKDCSFVINPDYADENTAKSLLRAVKIVDDDLLFVNGDVVFHPSVLTSIATSNVSQMLVNTEKQVGAEEVKYSLNSLGYIAKVSKTVEHAKGESLGLNFILKKDIPLFKECLEECNASDYFEKGIELAIQKGFIVAPCNISNDLCKEIDFPEDLEAVNRLLLTWD